MITILNNLLQLEDYFPAKAASMQRDIALFVRNHLPFIERSDLNVHANINYECIFIELSNKEFGNNKVVEAVYRPK